MGWCPCGLKYRATYGANNKEAILIFICSSVNNNAFVRLLHLGWHLGFKLETQWMEAHQTTLPTSE